MYKREEEKIQSAVRYVPQNNYRLDNPTSSL